MEGKEFGYATPTALRKFMVEHGATCRVPVSGTMPGAAVTVIYYHSPNFADRGGYTRWGVVKASHVSRLMPYMNLWRELGLKEITRNDVNIDDSRSYSLTQNQSLENALPQDDWRRYELIRHVGNLLAEHGFSRKLTVDTIWLHTHSTTETTIAERDAMDPMLNLITSARIAAHKNLTPEQREAIMLSIDPTAALAAVDEGIAIDFALMLYPTR